MMTAQGHTARVEERLQSLHSESCICPLKEVFKTAGAEWEGGDINVPGRAGGTSESCSQSMQQPFRTLTLFLEISFVCVCVILRMKPRTLCVLGGYSTTEPHLQIPRVSSDLMTA